MICKRFASALILEGSAGIGKTHLIEKVLVDNNVRYHLIAGYSSPRALVEALEEHKDDDVIWFDDLEGILADRVGKAVLKSCLDDRTGIRRIIYYTKKDKFDFVLKGRVVICMNTLPTDVDFLAVKDRCLYYKISLSFQEKLEMVGHIAKTYPEDLTIEERNLIFNFIKENSNEAVADFSIRTWFKICSMYRYDKDNWKTIALSILQPNPDLLCLKEVIEEHISVKEQVREFADATGKSRATFFRYKRSLAIPQSQSLTTSIPI